MTMTLNRLKQIERNLTPRQVILVTLDQRAEFETLEDYVLWGYTDATLAWMAKTRENMYAAIKQQARETKQDPNKTCRQGCREFSFLYDLSIACSTQFEQNWYRYLFSISTAIHWIGSAARKRQQEESQAETLEDLYQAKLVLDSLLIELFCLRKTSEILSKRYFESKPLLFRNQEVRLNRLTEHALSIVEDAHEMLATTEFGISIEMLKETSEQKAKEWIERFEHEAKIKILESEDRHSDAVKLFQQVFCPVGK